MTTLIRPLAAIALAAAALSADALTATIKREIPANIPGVALKSTPIQSFPGIEDPAFDGLQVWVPMRTGGVGSPNAIQRYDVVSNKLNGTITAPAGFEPRKVLSDGTYVWVFGLSNKVYKYDVAGKLQTGFPITLAAGSDRAVFDGDFIWANLDDGQLARINVATRAVTNFPAGYLGPVTFDGRNVWISASDGLVKFDTTALRVVAVVTRPDGTPLSGATGTSGLTFDGEYLWVDSEMGEGLVFKVNPVTNELVATVAVDTGVHGSAFDGELLWVVCTDANSVVKIDVRTNAVVGRMQMPDGTSPHDITFDGKFMWVTGGASGVIHKFFARL